MTTTTAAISGVAREIRDARAAAGMTRAQLAARAGCSLSMLGALEDGAVPRQSDVLGRVRAVLAEALPSTEIRG